MNIRKSAIKTDESSGQPNNGRRSFIWKAGAGLSAILAAAVPGIAGTSTNNEKYLKTRIAGLSKQVGILKDENNIRLLHQTYENLLDRGMYEEVVGLFTDDSEIIFNGGIFKEKNKGVSRLFCKKFKSGLTGKKIINTLEILADIEKQQNIIEIAEDRKTARARFIYSIQVGAPIDFDSILVEMARQVGRGTMLWWEGGICEIFCVKETEDKAWKIKRLEYKVLSRTNYRPGKSFVKNVSVPAFSKIYPEDPAGPDELINQVQENRVV